MTGSDRSLFVLAALHGAAAVAIGAFAAHAVADVDAKRLLDLGARYQAIHALAALFSTLAAARLPLARSAGWLFVAGAAIFAGSLYALAFGAPRWFGAVAPLGGMTLILGWLVLAFGGLRGVPAEK